MVNPFDRNQFLVEERVDISKAAKSFDIHCSETGDTLLHCQEKLSAAAELMSFSNYKRLTPFEIDISSPGGQPLVTVKRSTSLFLSNVKVLDESGILIGSFKQKFFSIGIGFKILDADNHEVCVVNGGWTGKTFSFVAGDHELAHLDRDVTSSWKERFTTAGTYLLKINDSVPTDHSSRKLMVTAIMYIDFLRRLKPSFSLG